jgi:hypothetical protein
MTATVFTLTETTDKSGYVLGVFADRAMAIDAARSHARHRIERCRAIDEKIFGAPVPMDEYDLIVNEPDTHANIAIVHRPSGEADGMAWQIWPFETIAQVSLAEAEQTDLFPIAP